MRSEPMLLWVVSRMRWLAELRSARVCDALQQRRPRHRLPRPLRLAPLKRGGPAGAREQSRMREQSLFHSLVLLREQSSEHDQVPQHEETRLREQAP
jgi:hypothetical protein